MSATNGVWALGSAFLKRGGLGWIGLTFVGAWVIGLVVRVGVAAQEVGAARFDQAALMQRVAEEVEATPGLEISVWVGDGAGRPIATLASKVPRPSASAIKPAILVEFFDARSEGLDRPLPGARAILSDPEHPAVVHFSEAVRAEIVKELADATVRQIGRIMIHGEGVSNAVYNAATNLAIADLGGPAEVTRRIRARGPDREGLAVRRYMLASRTATGDNQADARGLAVTMVDLAGGSTPNGRLAEATRRAVREALFLETSPDRGRHYFKSGALNSDPPVRIRSGWYERPGDPNNEVGPIYVLIASRRDSGGSSPAESGRRLEGSVTTLVDWTLRRIFP